MISPEDSIMQGGMSGAATGFAMGGPVGAAIGFAAGGILGGKLASSQRNAQKQAEREAEQARMRMVMRSIGMQQQQQNLAAGNAIGVRPPAGQSAGTQSTAPTASIGGGAYAGMSGTF